MDDSNKPPLFIAEEDQNLPKGPIIFPKDTEPAPNAPEVSEAPVPPAEAVPYADISVAAIIPPAPPVAEIAAGTGSIADRLMELKDNGIQWFKEHKFLGGILILLTFGILLYFWPLITCALVAQHMLKNTSGTANKMQMYKIVAILLVIAISIQAIWIVQLAQATSISPR